MGGTAGRAAELAAVRLANAVVTERLRPCVDDLIQALLAGREAGALDEHLALPIGRTSLEEPASVASY
jgi:hypothetical protein